MIMQMRMNERVRMKASVAPVRVRASMSFQTKAWRTLLLDKLLLNRKKQKMRVIALLRAFNKAQN
jgi:hypothetical protein